jgi:fluoride exporter
MKTDDLIERLARSVERVRPLQRPTLTLERSRRQTQRPRRRWSPPKPPSRTANDSYGFAVGVLFIAAAPDERRHGMERFVWICLGGAAGTGARYLIAIWAAQRLGSAFPYGTLIVNLTGCFFIAALMHAALTLGWSPTARSAITIGFIGGLTTYSSFNYETMRLFEEGAPATAGVNLAVTVLGGFAAGWLGLIAAREVLGR